MIALLAGLSACSGAASEPYEYEIVELPGGGADIDNPRAPYDALRDLAQERAAEEAGDSENAYRDATYFGADADSLLAYAITPSKGVFYYLPPGPYPREGNVMLALPEVVPVCRFVVEWAQVPGAPLIGSMEDIDLVSKDCVPFEASDYPLDPVDKDSTLTLIEAEPVEGKRVSVAVSASRNSRFDDVRALSLAAEAGGAQLGQSVPLNANGNTLLAGISDQGDVSLLIESRRLKRGQRCIVSGLEWSDLGDTTLRIAAERSCEAAAKARK
ncbi:hypothetical protein [Qipengyuania gelatinilytica]|uniref:Uncharacterized protein n=1 Tax=Qipengyuania gelatinilytica TaxID=2867231 RepID=A0ABX9A791_9SPHN|nr:hypothetical protein [Qipengyuania gelatinilytica]QZD96169.1 hypothetical protein K3136_05615 [Qipengyuania gelatinilytica]